MADQTPRVAPSRARQPGCRPRCRERDRGARSLGRWGSTPRAVGVLLWGGGCSELWARAAENHAPSGLCQDANLCPSVLKHGCASEGNFSLPAASALQEGAGSRRTSTAEHKGSWCVLPFFVTCLPLHPAWLTPGPLRAYPAPGC